MSGWALPLILAAALAPRSPDQRQGLADLAYVLGESHGLRQVCAPGDQTWRTRMSQMVEIEAPDQGFRRRLVDSFNAGFMTRQAEFASCTLEAAQSERTAAAKGAELSKRLSGVAP